MKKQQIHKGKPTHALTADWHLMDRIPRCRLDEEFISSQFDKLDWMYAYLAERDVSKIIVAGDLFHHWKGSPFLISRTIRLLVEHNTITTFVIAGNHDLPHHSFDNIDRSALGVLEATELICMLPGHHWPAKNIEDTEINQYFTLSGHERSICVAHIMTYKPGNKPWPNCTDLDAKKLIEKAKSDIVLTGHNHTTFTYQKKNGQILVNPGSLTRISADQIEHKPCFFLWYPESNTVEKVNIPIRKGVVSRQHLENIEIQKKRFARLTANLSESWEVQMQLEQNLIHSFEENKVPKRIQDMILSAIETEEE